MDFFLKFFYFLSFAFPILCLSFPEPTFFEPNLGQLPAEFLFCVSDTSFRTGIGETGVFVESSSTREQVSILFSSHNHSSLPKPETFESSHLNYFAGSLQLSSVPLFELV